MLNLMSNTWGVPDGETSLSESEPMKHAAMGIRYLNPLKEAFVVLWPSGHMDVICFGVRTLGIGLCLLPLMVPLARVIFRVVILC